MDEKPYWVFAGQSYCPSGGLRDYIDQYETCEDALEAIANHPSCDWWQIVMVARGEPSLVKSGRRA